MPVNESAALALWINPFGTGRAEILALEVSKTNQPQASRLRADSALERRTSGAPP